MNACYIPASPYSTRRKIVAAYRTARVMVRRSIAEMSFEASCFAASLALGLITYLVRGVT